MAPCVRNVLVIGATGAVGFELLQQLERDGDISEIHVVVRRPLGAPMKLSKVREHVMNFEALDEQSPAFAVDAVLCALGTTIKIAGSQKAFRRVDHDYTLNIARVAKARGVSHFLVVTAIGANSESFFFYNRVKGDVEKDLKQLQFPFLTVVRPSVMIRPTGEWRMGEAIGQKIAALLPKMWRAVPVSHVAQAMIDSLKSPKSSVRTIENSELF